MKKVSKLLMVLTGVLFLTGCGGGKTAEYEKEIETLNAKVAELEAENTALKEEAELVKEGEPVVLSGTIIVGTDIPAGSYDIKPAGDKSLEITFYESEAALEDLEFEVEFLYPADEEKDKKEADELKSYILREGTFVKMSTNTEFTRVK